MKIKEYLSNPATWISIIVAVFGCGITWGTLNYRIAELEKFKDEANISKIETSLAQIQTDIQWLKLAFQNLK